MPKLTRPQQMHIVRELACFERPSDVRDSLKALYGVEIVNLSQITYYDPTTSTANLADELRELFAVTRKKFVEDTADVAISHRSVRLRRLERLIAKLEQKLDEPLPQKNLMLLKDLIGEVRALYKQVAEEVGGVFTNRRELTGKDGERLIPAEPLDDMTDEELRELAGRLAAANES